MEKSRMMMMVDAMGDHPPKRRSFKMRPTNENRLALEILHHVDGTNVTASGTAMLRTRKRLTRIVRLTYDDRSDTIALTNSDRELYVVQLGSGQFWQVPIRIDCTTMQFSPRDGNHVVIGTICGDVTIVNVIDGSVVDTLLGHTDAVRGICVDGSGSDYRCVTWTRDDAIIWNLVDNTKRHILNLERHVALNIMACAPLTHQIIACFRDGTIYVWHDNTFELLKKMPSSAQWKGQINAIAVTKNGCSIAVGGTSSIVIVYDAVTWLPLITVDLTAARSTVKRLEFVPRPFDGGANRTVSVLFGNGRLVYIDVDDCGSDANVVPQLIDVECDREIVDHATSRDGNHAICLTSDGAVRVYHITFKYGSLARRLTVSSTGRRKSRSSHGIKPIKSQEMEKLLDGDRLRRMLRLFGEFPSRHRVAIWSSLLKLPRDTARYRRLTTCGSAGDGRLYASPFVGLERVYPLRDRRALDALKQLLNSLVAWCPFFAHVDYLPLLVFPFVMVLKNEPIALFETVVTFIVNWCQYWFEYHPMLPLNVFAMIENVLIVIDPDLAIHFADHHITAKNYAWPLMETLFTETTDSVTWCVIFDHVLANHPAFFVCLIVAYLTINRDAMIAINEPQAIESFCRRPNAYDVRRLLKKAYELLNEGNGDRYHPTTYVKPFRAISADGDYPPFDGHPSMFLNEEQTKADEEQLKAERELLELERSQMARFKQEVQREERERVAREEEFKRLSELESLYKSSVHHHRMEVVAKRETLANLRQFYTDEWQRVERQRNDQEDSIKRQHRAVQLRQLIDAIDLASKSTALDCRTVQSDAVANLSSALSRNRDMESIISLAKDSHPYDEKLRVNNGKESENQRKGSEENEVKTERLEECDKELLTLTEEMRALEEEIRQVRRTYIENSDKLRTANLSASLYAIDGLIERIEGEIKQSRRRRLELQQSEELDESRLLATKTKELEREARNLLRMIQMNGDYGEKYRRQDDGADYTPSYVQLVERLIKKHELNDFD